MDRCCAKAGDEVWESGSQAVARLGIRGVSRALVLAPAPGPREEALPALRLAAVVVGELVELGHDGLAALLADPCGLRVRPHRDGQPEARVVAVPDRPRQLLHEVQLV